MAIIQSFLDFFLARAQMAAFEPGDEQLIRRANQVVRVAAPLAAVPAGSVTDALVATPGTPAAGIKASKLYADLPFPGYVARSVLEKLADLPSIKDFGAIGDGTADDTAAFQAAAALGRPVYIPDGTYKITDTIDVTLSGTAFLGSGRGRVLLNSEAAGHTFDVATGLSFVEFRDFRLTRTSLPAVSGQNGIHFTNLTERALVQDVEISNHWVGLRCGITSFSKVINILCTDNYSHGILVTNADGAGGLQWTFINPLSQQNNGYGMLYNSPSGNAAVGEIKNPSTYANKLGGLWFVGTDAAHALNAIRIDGGFVGEDGNHGIYFDTYGSATVRVKGVYTEATGTSACGRLQSTAATNVGNGIHATANNTAVEILECHGISHSYSGFATAAARALITACGLRINGGAGTPGETSGIAVFGGNATISGNSSKGNGIGVSLANDAHVVVGNDLSENTTAPLTAAVSLINSVIAGNYPATTGAVNVEAAAVARGDADYTITALDNVVYTGAAFTAARTWTLPAASAAPPGKRITIADVRGAVSPTNSLTVQRSGSDTVDGGTSFTLRAAYSTLTLVSDGVSRWSTGIARGQTPATATNDNAAVGHVGEYIESVIALASAVSLTNNTQVDVTSISLTAGDWDVSAVAQFTGQGATNVFSQEASISTTTATLDYTAGKGVAVTGNAFPYNQIVGTSAIGLPIPPVRISLASTTTIYLVARSIFTSGTSDVYGIIRARRVR